MAPEDRRAAIVDVVVPLLLRHGGEVTTKQIAEAAGIAEGTIFRVFPDKAALLVAAAEETMNPSTGDGELTGALEGVTGLRARLLVTIGVLQARSERVTAVLMALRGVWTADGSGHRHGPPGPPHFVVEAHRALLDRLTDVLEPHRDELRVEPRAAALLLRTLVLGSRHPGASPEAMPTADEIADALLDGVRLRNGGR